MSQIDHEIECSLQNILDRLPWIAKIQNNKQHKEAIEFYDSLNHSIPVHNLLMSLVKTTIQKYEQELVEIMLFDRESQKMATGLPALILLMKTHCLKNIDLVGVLGSASLVSQIVNGNRNLTIPQIKVLADKFGVSPALFL